MLADRAAGQMIVFSLLVFLLARLLLGDARAQENPGIIHFPNRERSWNRIPSVAVASRENDPRIALVMDAVEFWNNTFAEIGTPRARRRASSVAWEP